MSIDLARLVIAIRSDPTFQTGKRLNRSQAGYLNGAICRAAAYVAGYEEGMKGADSPGGACPYFIDSLEGEDWREGLAESWRDRKAAAIEDVRELRASYTKWANLESISTGQTAKHYKIEREGAQRRLKAAVEIVESMEKGAGYANFRAKFQPSGESI